MRSNSRRLFPFFIALMIALLACGPVASLPTPDLHELETHVANTLAALSTIGADIVTTSPPIVLPSDTPAVTTQPAPPVASDTPFVPSVTSSPTTTNTPLIPCDKATFVSETIPDGSDFAPSSIFTKTWRVRNAGTCTWNTSYAIVFDHGDSLSSPVTVSFPGLVSPGQEVDLSLDMVAPATPGTYESFWKFINASGVIFVTNPFYVKIDVVLP